MSYLQIGFVTGLVLSHLAGVVLGLWLRERHWKGIREVAGI